MVKRDGWVITKEGAYGDLGDDCEITLDMTDYLKEFRAKLGLSQQEIAWMLGVTRTTYLNIEKGNFRDLTLREFLILASYVPETENIFQTLRSTILP